MSERRTSCAGIELAFFEDGAGEPSFLFVHGGGCSHSDWSAQVEALADAHRAIALDLPGHGRSGSETGLTVARIAQAVSAFVEAVVTGPLILVGHSFGCRVVLETNRILAGRVDGIVLVDGSNAGGWNSERSVEEVRAVIRANGVKSFLRSSFTEMFVERSDPAIRSALVARAQGWPAEVAESVLLSTIGWDIDMMRPALTSVEVPLLMLQSTFVDSSFRRRSLEEGMTTPWIELVHALVPSARVSIIAGTGHFPHVERADAVNDELRRFALLVSQEAPRPA